MKNGKCSLLSGWSFLRASCLAILSNFSVSAVSVNFCGKNTGGSGCAVFAVQQIRGGSVLATWGADGSGMSGGSADASGGSGIVRDLGSGWLTTDTAKIFAFADCGCVDRTATSITAFTEIGTMLVSAGPLAGGYYHLQDMASSPDGGGSRWWNADCGSVVAPTPPMCCITTTATNSTQFRQKYTVRNDTTLAVLSRSDWVSPGHVYSFTYCNTNKIPTELERLTDSDPPVIDFSVSIPTTDSAWVCDDVGGGVGFNDAADTGIFSSAPDAPAGGIAWPGSTNAASDEVLKRGFEALFGIDRMGFNNLLIVNRNIKEQNTVANTLATNQITAANSTVAGIATANGFLTTLGTLAQSQAIILTNIMNNTSNAPASGVLTNILSAIDKLRTNHAPENIGASNWGGMAASALGAAGLTNQDYTEKVGWTGHSAVTSVGSMSALWFETYGDGVFTEPSRSVWQFVVKGPSGTTKTLDCYPFQFSAVSDIAWFVKRAMLWLTVFTAYMFFWLTMKKAVEHHMLVQNMKAGIEDVATVEFFGGTGAARRVVFVAILTVLAASGAVWYALNSSRWGFIWESPFVTSSTTMQGAFWLIEKFFPISVMWELFCNCMIMFFIVKAAQLVANVAWKFVPIIILLGSFDSLAGHGPVPTFISVDSENSSHYWVEWRFLPEDGVWTYRFRQPPFTKQTGLLEYDGDMSGVYINPYFSTDGTNFSDTYAGFDVSMCGTGATNGIRARFVDTDYGGFPQAVLVEYTQDQFWSLYQGWYLGIGFTGVGLAIWIVRKITHRNFTYE